MNAAAHTIYKLFDKNLTRVERKNDALGRFLRSLTGEHGRRIDEMQRSDECGAGNLRIRPSPFDLHDDWIANIRGIGWRRKVECCIVLGAKRIRSARLIGDVGDREAIHDEQGDEYGGEYRTLHNARLRGEALPEVGAVRVETLHAELLT
jgi:hypothetical protein